jgi:hypothetical protein
MIRKALQETVNEERHTKAQECGSWFRQQVLLSRRRRVSWLKHRSVLSCG